jgi:hypothetical protein
MNLMWKLLSSGMWSYVAWQKGYSLFRRSSCLQHHGPGGWWYKLDYIKYPGGRGDRSRINVDALLSDCVLSHSRSRHFSPQWEPHIAQRNWQLVVLSPYNRSLLVCFTDYVYHCMDGSEWKEDCDVMRHTLWSVKNRQQKCFNVQMWSLLWE